jgi:hypothetical protein
MILGKKKKFSSSKVIPFILNLHSKAQHTHGLHTLELLYTCYDYVSLGNNIVYAKVFKNKKNLVLKVEDSKQLIILQTFAEFV